MHNYRSILSLALLTLTACGGDSQESKSEVAIVPSNISVMPKVDLTGKAGTLLPVAKKVKGVVTVERATVDNSFSNAVGSLRHAGSSDNVQGNLTLGITASDSDLLQKVSLFLPSVNRTFSLCSNNCTPDFQSTVTGFNPQLANVTSGSLRVELVVEDSVGNSVVVDALNLNWQPIQISSINATRENGVVSVSWSGNANLHRYNLYAATQHGLSTTNAQSLENGLQQLAINGTSVEFPDAELAKDYHLLITGIDNGGESGVSAPYSIPRVEGLANQPPIAHNDAYAVNEDETLKVNLLDNDQDPEGQLINLESILLQPSNGTVEVDELGNFIYVPHLNFHGKDSVSYRIIDTEGAISDAVVSIDVLPVNDNPIAVDDTYSVDINGEITSQGSNLLVNDSDIDGDELFVSTSPVSGPVHGTLSINVDGSFSYQSNDVLLESDQFTYQVTDNNGGTSNATVIIHPNEEVVAPLAQNDNYQIDEDTTLVIINVDAGILANDSDPNSLPFELLNSLLVQPQHGQLNLSLDGTFTYIPDSDFFGIDQFQYQIQNSADILSQAFVTIVVNAVADIPIALDDNYQVTEDINLTVSESNGLLANDASLENATVNVTPVSAPLKGILSLAANGSFSYLPDADFNGVDSFTYQVVNESELSSTAAVNITIEAVNDDPEAINDSFSTNENTALIVPVANSLLSNDIDVDGDVLTVNITPVTDVSHGSLTLNNDGSFSYTPTADFSGTDSFTYQIIDGHGGISQASVALTITSQNDTPIAFNDSYTLNEDNALVVASAAVNHLLVNDTDADGDSLTVNKTASVNVSNGSLTLNDDGSFTYSPNANFNGVDNFTYQISDGEGGIAQASVSLTINPVSDMPVAVADSYTIDEDTVLTKSLGDGDQLLSNDSDVDGDSLTVNTTPVSNVSDGSLSLADDGSFTYTPDPEFNGVDSFTYEIDDGNGNVAQTSVDITILAVNDAPTASNQAFSVDENKTDGAVVGTVGATDEEGDTLNYSLTAGDTGLFSIGLTTGEITVKGVTPLDYETSIQHSVTVTVSDNGTPTAESTDITVTFNIGDIVEGGTFNEIASFGRPAVGFVELTGVKAQAQLTDSVVDGSKIYFVGNIDNIDKDIYIIAYDKNGILDAGFGTGGIKTFDFGHNEYATSIVETGGKYYVAFNSDDGTYTEVCFLKIDNNADLVTNFGSNGISCTAEKSKLSVNDTVYNGSDIFAVGKVSGVNDDLLVIQMDKDGLFIDHTPLDSTDSPHIVQDVSGTSDHDEGMAIHNPESDDVLITGNVTVGGDQDIFAWLLDKDGVEVATFNVDGSAKFYDISGTNDEVYAVGGNKEGSFIAHLVGSTVVGSVKEALIVAIDETGTLATHFDGSVSGNGIVTYGVDGAAGAGTGYAEFTGIAFDGNELYVSGVFSESSSANQIKPFSTRIFEADGTIDTANYGDTDGYRKIDYASGDAFALSSSLDGDKTMWLPGYVESGSNTDMIISAVDQNGDLRNKNAENDFADGIETFSHSSVASDDSVAEIIQIQNGVQQGKFLLASVANDTTNDHVILTRVTSDGALDTSFSGDGHKQLQIGTSATVNGLFELADGKFIVYGNVTEATVVNGYIARIDQNGNLDSSFATNGIYTTATISTAISATKLTLQQADTDSLGNIVAVGNLESGSVSAFVIKLTSSGVIDTGFNGQGYVIGAADDDYTSLVIDGSDNIYAAGSRTNPDKEMLVAKYSSNGSPDNSFGVGGILTEDAHSTEDDSVKQIAFDTSSNNLYLIGNLGSPQKIIIVKMSLAGLLDNSFGISANGIGSFFMAPASANSSVYDAVIDNNDNIVVVGVGVVAGVNAGMIGRIKPDGTLDTTFNGTGYFEANSCTGPNAAKLTSVLLLNNSSLIVAGQCYEDATEQNNIEFSQYQLN